MKKEIKKLFALFLSICLIGSVFTVSQVSINAGESDAQTGSYAALTLGTHYFKASEEELSYNFPFSFEPDRRFYSYTPEEDCVLDAVVHDKEFHGTDPSWQFVITGGDLNTTLPASVKKGVAYTIEAQIENMDCRFSFETCDEIKTGETKTADIGEKETYFFVPEQDMAVTYSSSYTPADDETEDARAEALIKEDNEKLTSVQLVKPDGNNFIYSFEAKAGHTYILKNFHYWKSYQRNFGNYPVTLAEEKGFVIEDGTVVSYSGEDSDVVIPQSSAKGDSDPQEVTKIGDSSFSGNETMEEVAIPDTITQIGEKAFYNCPALQSVSIPDSVTQIGDHAFGYLTDDEEDPQKVEGFTICGYKDSAAERYAEENGFTFVRLDDYIEIALPSRTKVKRLVEGESVHFIYNPTQDGIVTFIDDCYWNEVEKPITAVSVVDADGNEVASADDLSHSVTGLPFAAEAGETYTITVTLKESRIEDEEKYTEFYHHFYYELRKVTEAALDTDYPCYSEYDDTDSSDFVDEMRYFKFTAPEDGTLRVKDMGSDLIEDGGHFYFQISDASKMTENARLPIKVAKGHTYYIKSNYEMITGVFQFTMGTVSTQDEATPDEKGNNGDEDSEGKSGGSGVSGGSGAISSGQSTDKLRISFAVMLAAAGVILIAGKKRKNERSN